MPGYLRNTEKENKYKPGNKPAVFGAFKRQKSVPVIQSAKSFKNDTVYWVED
jgi:hypothetical protein